MLLIKKSFVLFVILVFCFTLIRNDFVNSASYCEAIPVLTYHDVGYVKNPFTVTPEEFENQIQYLVKQGYTFLVPGDIDLFLRGKKKYPKKSVMITFDDACNGVYTYAYPILQKYNVRVTLFVVYMFFRERRFCIL